MNENTIVQFQAEFFPKSVVSSPINLAYSNVQPVAQAGYSFEKLFLVLLQQAWQDLQKELELVLNEQGANLLQNVVSILSA